MGWQAVVNAQCVRQRHEALGHVGRTCACRAAHLHWHVVPVKEVVHAGHVDDERRDQQGEDGAVQRLAVRKDRMLEYADRPRLAQPDVEELAAHQAPIVPAAGRGDTRVISDWVWCC